MTTVPCPDCEGSTLFRADACAWCEGAGMVCGRCEGSQYIRAFDPTSLDETERPCPDCQTEDEA